MLKHLWQFYIHFTLQLEKMCPTVTFTSWAPRSNTVRGNGYLMAVCKLQKNFFAQNRLVTRVFDLTCDKFH